MTRTMQALRDWVGPSSPMPADGPRTLAVAAGKGGVGVSTTTSLLALGAAAAGRRTLLVDAAPSGGSLSAVLGIDVDAAVSGGASAFAFHELSPRLRFTGLRPARWHGPGERQAALRRLGAHYADREFVILDAGATWDGVMAVLSAGAERLLAVSTADRLSVVATYALIKLVNERFPGLPVTVLLNHCEPAEGAAAFSRIASGVEAFLGRTVMPAGSFPSDDALRAAADAGASPMSIEGPAVHAARLLAELLSARGARRSRPPMRLS